MSIFFHNLSRYDAHHIIKNMTLLSGEKLSAISRTDETYISFSVSVPVGFYYTKNQKNATITNNLRFLDSFQFMSQSLDSLAKTLKTEDFSLLKTFFSSTHPTVDGKLLTRKGHFPCSYLDSFPKFEKPLPNYGDDWKNTLTGKIDISEADVAQAFKIYTLFGCRNLGDYHDVYLGTDVLIPADVSEKFRQVCMKVYKLDPVHFFSAPNLSWNAMLIATRVDLGLLSDIDMLFFERGIRGGINGIGELRHFRANKRDLDVFDESKANVYGAFFDVTSLYAGTMQQTLPVDSYEWNETSGDSVVGFFVEVDIAYPSSLHDSHNDLPLATEKIFIRTSWLSPYAQTFNVKLLSDGREKLVETLLDKSRYVCHNRNLKFYVNQGLKVRKLHRVIQFRQSKWLGDYISKNTIMRRQAPNDFRKIL